MGVWPSRGKPFGEELQYRNDSGRVRGRRLSGASKKKQGGGSDLKNLL